MENFLQAILVVGRAEMAPPVENVDIGPATVGRILANPHRPRERPGAHLQ